jgi:hypothetical protein
LQNVIAWSSLLAVLTAFYQLYFAVFHLRFWKRYRWDFDLRHASQFTRKIIRILSILLALQLMTFALILVCFRESVAGNPTGIAVLLQIAAFWGARLVLHCIFFDGLHARSIRWSLVFALGVVLPISCLILAP